MATGFTTILNFFLHLIRNSVLAVWFVGYYFSLGFILLIFFINVIGSESVVAHFRSIKCFYKSYFALMCSEIHIKYWVQFNILISYVFMVTFEVKTRSQYLFYVILIFTSLYSVFKKSCPIV